MSLYADSISFLAKSDPTPDCATSRAMSSTWHYVVYVRCRLSDFINAVSVSTVIRVVMMDGQRLEMSVM